MARGKVTTVNGLSSASAGITVLSALSDASMKKAQMKRLRAAAQIVADGIKAAAAPFSERIAASVKVRSTVKGVYIIAGGAAAPNAYPFETGAAHPLFGDRAHWYPQPKRQFLELGEAGTLDAAADEMSKVIDDWLEELGI